MLMAIDNVHEFLEGKTYDDLRKDKLLFFGVVKNIEIVGEAANNLTKELRRNIPKCVGRTLLPCAMCLYTTTTTSMLTQRGKRRKTTCPNCVCK